MCIVVDTYQVGLVESKDILEKCGKVAVIDHHRKGVGYMNPALVCHEPYSSSASELVTELLQYVGERDDKPNRVEAVSYTHLDVYKRQVKRRSTSTLPPPNPTIKPVPMPFRGGRPSGWTVLRAKMCIRDRLSSTPYSLVSLS